MDQAWPQREEGPADTHCDARKVDSVDGSTAQVDFGGLGLGDGSTDLEHSIMLRQRSLSSRTSLDDLAK